MGGLFPGLRAFFGDDSEGAEARSESILAKARGGSPDQTAKEGEAVLRQVPGLGDLWVQRSWRARRYRLSLRRDGSPVLTLPLKGDEREGLRFVLSQSDWLERARARQDRRPRQAEQWTLGTSILWRGNLEVLRQASAGAPTPDTRYARFVELSRQASEPAVCLAADVFRVPSLEGDLKPVLEKAFVEQAKVELNARGWELAARTNLEVKQFSVRNQRSRWGSCSTGGVISLNWRLIQTPDFVRDYIIYHELAHTLEMNHSERFWSEVERLCPTWREAEAWIKKHSGLTGL